MKVMICALLMTVMSISPAFAVNFSITMLKSSYYCNKAITAQYQVVNDTDKELSFFPSDPEDMDLEFSSKNDKVTIFHSPSVENTVIIKHRLMRGLQLPAHKSFSRMIVLNKFMSFKAPGKFSIGCNASASYGFGRSDQYIESQDILYTGNLSFTIKPQRIPRSQIYDIARRVRSSNEFKAEEALECLLWVDDGAIVPALAYALKIRLGTETQIVRVISKYIASTDAQKAVLAVALTSDHFVMTTVLEIFQGHRLALPKAFIVAVVKNEDDNLPLCLLEHLLACGTADQVELIRPLLTHENTQVRSLAAEFIEKMSRDENTAGKKL